jgi:LmbE family N-acetylglucosaminyl deacetylase
MPTSPSLAAKVLGSIRVLSGEDADGAHTRVTIRDVVTAHLVDAEITANLEIIAENTGHADREITQEAVTAAWESTGQRIQHEVADRFLAALGIRVTP